MSLMLAGTRRANKRSGQAMNQHVSEHDDIQIQGMVISSRNSVIAANRLIYDCGGGFVVLLALSLLGGYLLLQSPRRVGLCPLLIQFVNQTRYGS